ncbi:HECT-domain-containing protein [Laetiporus sulphureus 93-53]|uniref:HECT-type E3 ubiquitin transferase n=1 Tax=Laetiporus sulphureus 93-53 TaxID=1314785 RepID=A0A165B7M5_9APHY|nr:HECT-domain-containing protein [Laetiporus sulphureus 93-53]KZT00431.1 HECT-domain-containing protein [Laetiporus sulphureus 93-53]
MTPLFGDELTRRRKEINLGGIRSASNYSDILHEAKKARSQRHDLKRRQDSATKIQAWWRGSLQARETRQELRRTFAQDVVGLTGLRCLVLIGKDEDVLGQWSTAVANGRQDVLLHDEPSWHTLLKRTALLLLESLSLEPQSQYALSHLTVLNSLLSSTPAKAEYVEYLLDRGYYRLLGQALLQIPVESKAKSPSLPPLVSLITLPLSYSVLLPQCLTDLVIYILTIPLLPNRLPIESLKAFTRALPLSSLHIVAPSIESLVSSPPLSPPEPKIHLLANLVMFAPPAYPKLSPAAFDAYLQLMSALMNHLPTHALEPPEKKEDARNWADGDESDEDEDAIQVSVVTSFEPKSILPELDNRTRMRLQTLPSPDHLHALLQAAQRHPSRLSLISFFFALTNVWPSRKDKVLGTVVAFNRGGLVREIYRLYVRSSPIGREDTLDKLTSPEFADSWPPLLFLIDLYTQALLTMGDDEFFSSALGTNAPRNPLALDEIVSFSRRLLNAAFTLYWREDLGGAVPGLGVLQWATVRFQLAKCLQAIHARDSRRRFTPPDHWLVTSQVDMTTFIQAAVIEEQNLAQPHGAHPLTKRQVAYLSPRLGVLNNIPFAIPFETRVAIFRNFIRNDMATRGVRETPHFARQRVVVRRGSVAQDGFDKLEDADLHAPIMITFVDQFGNEEAGIDGGGVFKEFLTSLCKEVFDTDRGLWLANKANELYPNPHSYATESHSLSWYRFIGRILGKALYEGILVDVAFAGFFLAKWLGKQSFLDDLASLDPELYQGLIFLKHYEGNPEDLTLNFTVAEQEFGVTRTIELIPNGSNIAVTRENKLQYIYLVSHYRLNKQIKKQSEAFFEGLSDMIDPKWLRMFNQQELQILLGGVNSPIDLDDLRQNTNYGGLYDDHHPTIEIFWRVVNSFDQEKRRELLRFATSCSRPPLLGFKELVPNFSIRDSSSDENRLPTASTCVNLLKLPRYQSEKVLREKLVQAITSNAGFDLS